jgi:thiosulfate reductase cytochrome b subunit
MKEATKRSIIRWIHIVMAIPIVGYIYSPFDQIPNYATVTRYVYVPILVLSGLWMWKGHVVRRLIFSKPANQLGHQNGTRIEA